MALDDREIAPAGLAARLAGCSGAALASGALRPIATRELRVADAGVPFLVRQVDSLARKARHAASPPGPAQANPFLPPEPDLTLGPLSSTHVAVLNKFNVLADHLLIVTRAFVDQETLLGPADLEALWLALSGIDGLGFYNGGASAGASQPHKHLQLIPLPLDSQVDAGGTGPRVPMDEVLDPLGGRAPAAPPFAHALVRLDWCREDPGTLHLGYRRLLERIGVDGIRQGDEERQSAPYNLLVTRRWMLAVPRVAESVDGVSINALGFAGSFFVKDEAQLQAIRRRGPMETLCSAAGRAGSPERTAR